MVVCLSHRHIHYQYACCVWHMNCDKAEMPTSERGSDRLSILLAATFALPVHGLPDTLRFRNSITLLELLHISDPSLLFCCCSRRVQYRVSLADLSCPKQNVHTSWNRSTRELPHSHACLDVIPIGFIGFTPPANVSRLFGATIQGRSRDFGSRKHAK